MGFLRTLQSLTRIRGHALSTIGLGPDSIVIDAGAHRGEFSLALAARFGSRCYLVEANPQLAGCLKHVASFAGVVEAALCAHDGRATFYVRENPESGSICDRGSVALAEAEVTTSTLGAVLDRLGVDHVDLLKLDIEGAEFELLADADAALLENVGQITVEFHDFLPAFRGRGLFDGVRRRLRDLGFVCCSTAFRTHGDVLFINRKKFGIGMAEAAALAACARWRLKFGSAKFREADHV